MSYENNDCRCRSVISLEQEIKRLNLKVASLTKLSECKSYQEILSSYEIRLLGSRMQNICVMSGPFQEDSSLSINKTNMKFYTITFSPKRFYEHTDQQYIDYIYFHIYQLFSDKLLTYAYGCFEHHKSGVIHCHVIITSYQHDLVNKYLNQKFNHDARNRKCIDSSFIKSYENTVNYINKESSEFFRIGRIELTGTNDLEKA